MMLWLTHFFPQEDWALTQRQRSLVNLDRLWVEPPGYFCRVSRYAGTRLAFSNYGVSLGLQAARQWPERVQALHGYFATYRSGDEYDTGGDHACHGLHRIFS